MMIIIIIGDSWYGAAEAGRKSVAVATTVWHHKFMEFLPQTPIKHRLWPPHLTTHNSCKFILQFWQIHFAIWTNTLCNLDRYILQFGQMQFAIQTNTFCNLDECILQLGQIYFAIRTNTFWNLDKYISNLDKYISNLDKYRVQLGQIHFAIWTSHAGQFLLRASERLPETFRWQPFYKSLCDIWQKISCSCDK